MHAFDTPTAAAGRSWRARAVFLSSTFADMHAERDYLRLHTCPELEERLRDRCHDREVIDLRQGVETAGEQDEAQREIHQLLVRMHASGLWLDATTEALLAELDRDAVTSGASVMPPSRLAILRSALGLKDA
jgi:hypothetical protein